MQFTAKEEPAEREDPGQTAADHIKSDICGVFQRALRDISWFISTSASLRLSKCFYMRVCPGGMYPGAAE